MTTVPYISQVGNIARNDCGPTCALMLARWVGRALDVRVEDWARQYDPNDDGTTAQNIVAMLASVGLKAYTLSDDYPRIELVQYGRLPPENRMVKDREFLHWIVRLADDRYHDPYHRGTAGANLYAPKSVLDSARVGNGVRIAIYEKPQGASRVNPDWLRLRSMPTMAAENQIAWIKPNTRMTSLDRALDERGRAWIRVAFDVPSLASPASQAVPYQVQGWCAEWLTQLVGDPPPPPPPPPPQIQPARMLLGVNVLGNHRFAEDAYQAGCRYFVWMEGLLGAYEFKQRHPDATVIYRKWIEHGVRFANGAELARYVGVGSYPGLIYMGYNEADQWGQDGNDLRVRLMQDIEAARIARAGSSFYIAGSFSMGTPDFTNEETRRIIREVAAPAYNSGLMGFDMHLYSPTLKHIEDQNEWKWFERRWEFLFTHCGFDPKVRAIYCTETGLDEGGVGGFAARDVPDAQFEAWCRQWLALCRLPILGQSSPLIGAALFQLGDGERWGGYNVQRYLGVLARMWR